jgi:hypothetical protein
MVSVGSLKFSRLPTARSGCPSSLKSPTAMYCGAVKPPVVDMVGKAPVPSPKRTVTSFDPTFAVAKSGAQSPLKSATTM